MGPGGMGEPGSSPKFTVVRSSDIDAEPGHPLSADYWCNRQPGESWTAFRVRRQAEDAERRAAKHEATALHLRAEAGQMRLAAGLPAGPVPGVYLLPLAGAEQAEPVVLPAGAQSLYDRGRADMLAHLAAMPPAERAELLSRARHPSRGGGGE